MSWDHKQIRNTAMENTDNTIQKEIYNLGSDVSRLQANVESLSNDVRSVVSAVKDLAHTQATSQKTPWSTLIGMASIFLVISGVFGGIYIREIDKMETDHNNSMVYLKESLVLEMTLRDKLLEEQIK